MPELPDITVYIEALDARVVGRVLETVSLASPFLLRTAEPPLASVFGQRVRELRRLGKRIAIGFENQHWLVCHLMIAGRLHWFAAGTKPSGRKVLARFVFDNGTLTLTEAGTQRRASLHIVGSTEELRAHERGGLEVLDASSEEFARRLRSENHTLKRALTDPALFSGIGNAYPVCRTSVQRIRYASNETNYCPRCQTDGRVLADRSLSRLLKDDWPTSIEELEAKKLGSGRSFR